MSYSVLNDLAEAMKALDGKKSSCGAGTWQPPTNKSRCLIRPMTMRWINKSFQSPFSAPRNFSTGCTPCENPTWYSVERSVTLHSFDFTKYRLWTSLFRLGTIVNGQIVVCSFDLTEYHL